LIGLFQEIYATLGITYVRRDIDTAYNQFIENYEAGIKQWEIITLKEAMKKHGFSSVEVAINKFPERVIRYAEPNYDGVGKETKELIDKSKKTPNKIFQQERTDYQDIYLLNGQRVLFYKDKLREIDGEIVTSEPLTNFWSDIPFQGIAKEGKVILKKGKKPEFLLKRIMEFSTVAGDLILDYHLGSGTTCAVAHKMGRQYIGIEQLNYGENNSVVRLQNVIKGDQSGISKSVNWKGGGSFLYCEIMEYNEAYINSVRKAKTTKELLAIWEEMQEKAFISYKIDPKTINANISEFESLSLDEQRRFLIELLDKNQLYVNYSEIYDEDYKISDTDKKLNRIFYGE